MCCFFTNKSVTSMTVCGQTYLCHHYRLEPSFDCLFMPDVKLSIFCSITCCMNNSKLCLHLRKMWAGDMRKIHQDVFMAGSGPGFDKDCFT